ncbi:hypothetical protein RY831_25030 [Noviherbaspirillum sp. CPCC 100848]|uniref:Uncharacterized protein n=1 Tax=Noviherbaspirillum album TaxID=3080276 RepID=A0ABU6JFK5_9BURK|nr:hypothetical protein [Noviherbaspirillum sp. CPCC 100848]MEC4722432.1 hypothetical protein [Noviherbaspirillum sp. CPCC 100848]
MGLFVSWFACDDDVTDGGSSCGACTAGPAHPASIVHAAIAAQLVTPIARANCRVEIQHPAAMVTCEAAAGSGGVERERNIPSSYGTTAMNVTTGVEAAGQ